MEDFQDILARAQWISGPMFEYGEGAVGYYDEACEEHRTHIVTRIFSLSDQVLGDGPISLLIAVAGLARVRINGRPLGAVEVFGHWTRFDKIVYFDALDATRCLHAGDNMIEIELGNGFYNPAPMTLFGKYNLRERLAEVGTPMVVAALVQDGAPLLMTDASWQLRRGQLIFNNPYLGEVCDLACAPVHPRRVTVREPGAARAYAPSPIPPIRRQGSVAPVSMSDTDQGVLVDFGVMVAGTIDVSFTARAGDRIECVYAEAVEGDRIRCDTNVAGLIGMITPSGVCPGGPGAPSPAVQRDVIICRAGENSYTSAFTYHSFRYALVRGLTSSAIGRIEAVYVHTDVARAGKIDCGDEEFDRLVDAAVRTKLNNVHGIWEDCSRERFGYGGDMVSLANSNLMLFDEEGLLDRTLGDFARDQTERGGIPETAPFMGIGSNGPAYGEGPLLWQLAYPYLAVQADRYYGRRDLIEREWDGIARFGDYLISFDPEELARHCLGDHGSILTGGAEGFKSGTPDKELLGWCAILWNLLCVAEAGRRGGRDVERFESAAGALRSRIIDRFLRGDGSFGDGTQSACAFAGMLGLDAPEHQAELLARDFHRRGDVLTTGIFGTMLAFDLLNRTGRDDVVETWLVRTEHPSLLAMLQGGNGALAEQFTEDLSSLDHAMFTSYAQWFMQALGGIRVADDAVGADKIIVAPYFSGRTDRVRCAYATRHGHVKVEWTRPAEGSIRVTVQAPGCIDIDAGELAKRPDVVLDIQQTD